MRSRQGRTPAGDEPGADITSVEVDFFARSTPERWRDFMETLGCTLRPSSTDPENLHKWFTDLTAIPDALEQRSRFLNGEVHPNHRDPGETHWVLRLEAVPSLTPPQSIIEKSRRVGGYPGVLDRLAANWPAERQLGVQAKVVLVLDESKWRSPFAPRKRMALEPVAANGQQAVLSHESYSWEFKPSGPLSKIIDLGYVDEKQKLFALSCSGHAELELGPGMFSRVEATLWQTVRGLLRVAPRRSSKR